MSQDDVDVMDERPVKLRLGPFPDGAPVVYENAWSREETTGPERLRIGAAGSAVDAMLALADTMDEPFSVLYLLQVPRGPGEPGRYQSKPLTREELADLCNEFRDYFERDARHEIWIASRFGGQLVYDEHGVIFAYGDLDLFVDALRERRFIETDFVGVEGPHTHSYHAVFDDDQQRLLDSDWGWQCLPLRPEDER